MGKKTNFTYQQLTIMRFISKHVPHSKKEKLFKQSYLSQQSTLNAIDLSNLLTSYILYTSKFDLDQKHLIKIKSTNQEIINNISDSDVISTLNYIHVQLTPILENLKKKHPKLNKDDLILKIAPKPMSKTKQIRNQGILHGDPRKLFNNFIDHSFIQKRRKRAKRLVTSSNNKENHKPYRMHNSNRETLFNRITKKLFNSQKQDNKSLSGKKRKQQDSNSGSKKIKR